MTKKKERRGNLGNLKPWPKGVSGNPKGRPKAIPKLEKLLAEALGSKTENGEGSKIKEVLDQLIGDATSKHSLFRTRAGEVIMDRVYGKSKESKAKDEEDNKPKQITGFKVNKKK